MYDMGASLSSHGTTRQSSSRRFAGDESVASFRVEDVRPDFEEDEVDVRKQVAITKRVRKNIKKTPSLGRLRHARSSERSRKIGQKPDENDNSCAGIFRV